MKLADLPTPALVLDWARLARNTARMARRLDDAAVALRPHMKTAKCARVADLATAGHFGGVTVSTLAEAAYFADHRYRDITYAVGIVPAKLAQAAAIARRGVRLNLLTDDARTAQAVAGAADGLGARFPVFIEIDSGQHRAGVAPGSDELLEIGRVVDGAAALELAGVLTHAGQSYHCHSIDAVRAVAEEERLAVVTAAERLRAAELPCPAVSAGSTPTAVHAEGFAGLTEMRPGVYMFFDLDQYGLGSCGLDDLALSVLATVISHSDRKRQLLVDAGALALSKDQLAAEFLGDVGYGWVCDPLSLERIASLRVASVDQEHGYVGSGEAGAAPPYGRLPVGSRVRILPNHACLTAAAYDRYYLVDSEAEDPDAVIDVWERVNGWYGGEAGS